MLFRQQAQHFALHRQNNIPQVLLIWWRAVRMGVMIENSQTASCSCAQEHAVMGA